MTGPAVRDLLAAAAPEPARPLDADALIGLARRRQQRRRVAVAAPLVAAVALVAGPVIAWPDLPAGQDVGRVLGLDDPAAPVLTGRYPAEAVGNGQSPAEPGSEAVELAAADLPDGRRIFLVGYRDIDGRWCTGFVGAGGTGLPSSCPPTSGGREQNGLVFGSIGETDASGAYIGTVYVSGSAPAQAAYVRLHGSGPPRDYPVTTTDDSHYDSRTYFIAVLDAGYAVTGGTAHNSEGDIIATR